MAGGGGGGRQFKIAKYGGSVQDVLYCTVPMPCSSISYCANSQDETEELTIAKCSYVRRINKGINFKSLIIIGSLLKRRRLPIL